MWRLCSDDEECGVGCYIKISSLWMLKCIVKKQNLDKAAVNLHSE